MTSGMDWARWLYREEKLHTSVLANLLRSDLRDQVAAALVGVGATEGMEQTVVVDTARDHDSGSAASSSQRARWVALESRVGRRTADLSCRLVVGRVPRRLVVETKVDSVGTRDQLTEMSWANDQTVLLTLGTSAFDRSQLDLDHDAGFAADPGTQFVSWEDDHLEAQGLTAATIIRRTTAGTRAWATVTPRDWLTVLATGGVAKDPNLDSYLRRMRLEAELHSRAARAAVSDAAFDVDGLDLSVLSDDGDAEARVLNLLASAWAAEVRRHVWERQPALNLEARRDGRGVRLGVYPVGWTGDLRGDVIVQLDVRAEPGNRGARATGAVRASGLARSDKSVAQTIEAAPRTLLTVEAERKGASRALARSPATFAAAREAAAWIVTTVDELGDGVGGRRGQS